MPHFHEEIKALSSALENVTARENEAAVALAKAGGAERLTALAIAEREESLKAEVTESERQFDVALARLTQARLKVKVLKDTLVAEKAEAVEVRRHESAQAEAKLLEAQALFDQTVSAFETTIVSLEEERCRLRDEAAHLEAIAQSSHQEHELARAEATLQFEVAQDELARLSAAERTLEAKKRSAQREYDALLLQVSSAKAAVRDAETNDTFDEAALLASIADDHRADEQRADALEEEVAGLEAALRDAVARY